ncbi:zinc finger protein 260-like isoform X2 [Anthonomus grandis grandis]|nr:zinc finger protein 260-like isoform X2 [Anthonomus grandis grandis]
MFHPLAHQIFDGIRLEPLNYYSNNATSNNTYNNYQVAPTQSSFLTPEVSITYESLQEPKQEPLQTDESMSSDINEPCAIIKQDLNDKPMSPIVDKKPKPQTCKICNKTLASASSYYVHMKQHSASKPFMCTNCNAAFCRKPYLEVHMRVHTGERPYQCDVCKKRFTQKSSLNTHKRGHSGLRPYVCQICRKTFTVKSYLTAHKWTHISDSGISCSECDVSFTSKNAYLQHMDTHNKREFFCRECDKGFMKESYLIRHVNRIHNKNSLFVNNGNCFVNGTKT